MTTLKEYVRERAEIAEKTCMTGDFNAMSWLDLELEETPWVFDEFFDTPWAELSENEQPERLAAIRSVL